MSASLPLHGGHRRFAELRSAHLICSMALALPFLFPLVSGPSVAVWQLLVTWLCIGALAVAAPLGTVGRPLLALMGGTMLAVVSSAPSEPAVWAPAVGILAMMGLAACIGAGAAWAQGRQAGWRALAHGLLAAGLLSALLGLIQYHGLAGPLRPWAAVPMEGIGMAYGNLRQRNQLATLLSLALVALLWLHVHARPRGRRVLLAAAGLLVAGLAASTSRTGLLQMLAILGGTAALGWRERRLAVLQGPPRSVGDTALRAPAGVGHLLPSPPRRPALPRLPHPAWALAALGLYTAMAWLLPWSAVAVATWQAGAAGGADVQGMLVRLREGAPPGHSRWLLWQNVLHLIAERPWTGWGWERLSLAHYLADYPGPRFVEILDNAHNLPLHLAVELGLPAAVLICGGFLALVLAARPWRERDPLRLMGWALLGVLLLHSLLEYPLWYGPFQLVFGLCLGLLWPARRPCRSAGHRSGTAAPGHAGASSSPTPFALAAAAAILVGTGYAGWHYVRVSQAYLPAAQRLPGWQDAPLARLDGSDWLFARQARFAALALTPLRPETAEQVHALATASLAFSPEPRVVLKLIDSARLLGREAEVRQHVERLRQVYPKAYLKWLAGQPPA